MSSITDGLTLSDGIKISGNEGDRGGGLYTTASQVILQGAEINENKASGNYGGGGRRWARYEDHHRAG